MGQRDMGKKLVSRPDVMSLSGVMYPYVFTKSFNTTQKTFNNLNLVNKFTYFVLRKFIYLFIYLFIKENVAINTITNIKLILFSKNIL